VSGWRRKITRVPLEMNVAVKVLLPEQEVVGVVYAPMLCSTEVVIEHDIGGDPTMWEYMLIDETHPGVPSHWRHVAMLMADDRGTTWHVYRWISDEPEEDEGIEDDEGEVIQSLVDAVTHEHAETLNVDWPLDPGHGPFR